MRFLKSFLGRLLAPRPVALPTVPIPAGWGAIVERLVPLSRSLPDAERARLLRLTQLFLKEVPLEGCGGLTLTEEISVTIASTASILLLNLPYPRFPRLRRVLVYPDTFVPVRLLSHLGSAAPEEPEPTLGEAWHNGIVVLSWSSVRDGGLRDGDGHNVVLHEFAHVLDHEDGTADGRPILGSPDARSTWATILGAEFARHQATIESGADSALDPYGAKNSAEFFAVATEAFFECGQRLRDRLPELYDLLRRFYQQDPAERSVESRGQTTG